MYRPPVDQILPDLRDDEERGAVGRILSVLPADHPAHEGHRGGLDTIAMTHLVAERPDLVAELIAVYLARLDRVWKCSRHFRP